ncbi:MAG: RluA family pseudouridine synthase [Treponema sp.]
MFPPFPEDEALAVCGDMISQLEDGILELRELTCSSEERAGQGLMLGAAICLDKNGKRTILKTVSGIRRELRPAHGLHDPESVYVPPIVGLDDINAAIKANDLEIHRLTAEIKRLKALRKRSDGRFENPSEEETQLAMCRKHLTTKSLKKVYELYSFCCSDGKMRSLNSICPQKLPPTGTGDCSAPKLLHYAFSHKLTIVSMAEVFYGGNTVNKICGKSYPPCDERCALILPAMLGLSVIYRDESIIVINKPAGLLSVPGRGEDKQDCIVNRVRRLFPTCIAQPAVHRLDMETSGLMVLAFNTEAHRRLSRQFEQGLVKKTYTALLDGKISEKSARMELYFRLDIENRPHQIWDEINGKKAVTEWQNLGEEMYVSPEGTSRCVTRLLFTPLTGRTHQLRLASADKHGFGIPIIGDSLYGTRTAGERLMLHAKTLEFAHPMTERKMTFETTDEF